MSLSTTIKSIQDIMRKDDGVDGDAQRIGQLTWMLFLKVLDQREEEWEDQDKNYKSLLPEECRWRNWAAYVPDKNGTNKPQIEANELIGFVNNILFSRLRAISKLTDSTSDTKEIEVPKYPLRKVISQVFEDSINYMKSGTLMLGVIGKLNESINFHDFTTRQNLGDIYEQILNDLRSAGNAGEFYTPRAITTVMVQLVNPRLEKYEVTMDPACGTGGFLTATIDHLRGQLPKNARREDQEAIEQSIVRTIVSSSSSKPTSNASMNVWRLVLKSICLSTCLKISPDEKNRHRQSLNTNVEPTNDVNSLGKTNYDDFSIVAVVTVN